jgi:RNA polymerase-binding transcription factor
MSRKNETIDRERYLLLKGMLEDRRREIHEKLRSLREALPAATHDVRDAEEQSVDEFVQEVDLALMQMKSDTLKKIDAAILRLEDGSYGRCDECEQEISSARLRALPFAVLCRDCQEQAEDRVRYEREAKAFARLQKELASVTLRTGNARD